MSFATATALAEGNKALDLKALRPFTGAVIAFPDPQPASLEDANALLLQVAAHDRAAFSALFDHFAPRLNAYIRKLGTDAAQAEELVQETMLTVWRKAGSFDPVKASASTWIYTIARNKRIDALRRERRPELDPTDAAFVPDDHAEATSDPIDAAAHQKELAEAIAALPPEQAELLRLAYYEDKAHTEIAAQQKLPLGTVKSRLRLALDKLRRTLRTTDE